MSSIQANNTYALTNLQSGTCVDLSGADNTSIIGYGYHQGPNQKWTFESASGDKTFNVKSSGSGQYLSVNKDAADGTVLVAAGSPFAWCLEDEPGTDGGIRISPASDKRYCVDMADHGSSKDGTAVQLWSRWGGKNQVWKAQQVQ